MPGSSTRRSPHFSSAVTRKASGLPVTSKDGSAEFFCLRAPRCRLQERIADRRDAQQYFRPKGPNFASEKTANPVLRGPDPLCVLRPPTGGGNPPFSPKNAQR